jgi:hypothetical protein
MRVGLIVIASAILLSIVFGWYPWVLAAVAVAGAIAFLNARDWEAFGREPFDLPSTAPKVSSAEPQSLDLGDELADLLKSAMYRARRSLEDTRRLDPFVMYEDAAGNVRIKRVDGSDPERTAARAREVARAVDAGAPRIVLAVPSVAELDGRPRRVVLYEAAERRFRERTLAFVQPYRPARLFLPVSVSDDLLYVGDAAHILRFVDRAPAPPAAGREPDTS